MMNRDQRQKLQYRHEFDISQPNPENKLIRDFFDGTTYQDLLQQNEFSNKFDMAFTLTTDGFVIFRK